MSNERIRNPRFAYFLLRAALTFLPAVVAEAHDLTFSELDDRGREAITKR
jgi:hypothetical protein